MTSLALFVGIVLFFSYYAWSWLQSIGSPESALAGFDYHYGLAELAIWLSTLVLVGVANGVMWLTGRVWAMWVTFFYFVLAKFGTIFWLENAHAAFLANTFGGRSGIVSSLLITAILSGLVGAVIFFDQYIVIRLREKTLGNDGSK